MKYTNGRFRKKQLSFTQISNNIIDNTELSLKAKGLYITIQRYITMPDWELYREHLISLSKDGEKSFNSGWKELKDKGYLKQYRIPSKEKKGTFIYEYDLLDEPDLSTPSLINCDINGNPKIKKDHDTQNGSDGENNLRPYPPKRIVCSKDSMLNGGDINNTNNTNTNNTNTNIDIIYLSNNNNNNNNNNKTYCNTANKDEVDRKIEYIKKEIMTEFSTTSIKKLLNASNGDEVLVVDTYEQVMDYLINNPDKKVKSFEAFLITSVKRNYILTTTEIFNEEGE